MTLRKRLVTLTLLPVIALAVTLWISTERLSNDATMKIVHSDLADEVAIAKGFLENIPETDTNKVAELLNKKIVLGDKGFLFVINSKGDMVIHKKVQGKNWISKPFIKHIAESKSGFHRYLSPKTGTYKIAAYTHIPERDWIVVASKFEDDFLGPARAARQKYFAIITAIAAAAIFIIVMIVVRSLAGSLCRITNSLNRAGQISQNSGSAIAAAGQSLADSCASQAASMHDVTENLQHITDRTRQNSDSSQQADELMRNSSNIARQTRTAMREASESIGQIKHATDQTLQIIKQIDEIAFQTRLLALNASVEAARAGEAGKGFAVVADEVRNLAMRSTQAAGNTSEHIEKIATSTDIGVEAVDAVLEKFNLVADEVEKAEKFIAEISTSCQQQTLDIDHIQQSTGEIGQITQQNAASAEESASASAELLSQADELNNLVTQLGNIVGSSSCPASKLINNKKTARQSEQWQPETDEYETEGQAAEFEQQLQNF